MAFWGTTLAVCLVIFGKSTANLSLINVSIGDSFTLSCNPSATEVVYYRDVTGPRKTVAEFEEKLLKPGLGDEHRVKLQNFTVTLRSVFNDNGYFECRNRKKDVLRDFQVVVRAPIPVGRAAYVGSSFNISFYGSTAFQTSYMMSSCSKDGVPMLAVRGKEISVEKEFEHKVSVSEDAYLHGELRITFPILSSSDQGLYECSIAGDTPRAVFLTTESVMDISSRSSVGILGWCVSVGIAICFVVYYTRHKKYTSKFCSKRTSCPAQETPPVYHDSHGP